MAAVRSASVSNSTATPANDLSTTTLTATGSTPAAPSGYTKQEDNAWSETVTLNSGNSWTDTVRGLDKADGSGNEYVYYIASVSETNVPSGTSAVIGSGVVYGNSAPGTLTVTDTLPTTTLSAHKDWQGENPSVHPASVTFHLWADGTEVTPSKQANSSNSWTVSWGDLPYYNASGSAITYTVTEDAVTGYDLTSATYSGGTFTLVNTYVPQTGSLKFTKLVKVNGGDPAAETYSLVNGEYTFTIASTADTDTAAISKTLVITLSNGTYTATLDNIAVDADGYGYFSITDLPLGTYTITEADASRAGYNLVTTFTVGGTATTDNNVQVTLSGTTLTATVDAENAYTAGVELPATGGTGTLPYTLTGLTLLLGASLILYYRRRRREQN